jgi:hypothetical protein
LAADGPLVSQTRPGETAPCSCPEVLEPLSDGRLEVARGLQRESGTIQWYRPKAEEAGRKEHADALNRRLSGLKSAMAVPSCHRYMASDATATKELSHEHQNSERECGR